MGRAAWKERVGRTGCARSPAAPAPRRPWLSAAPAALPRRSGLARSIAAEDVDIGAAVGAAATAPWPPGAPLGLYRREKTTPHARNGPRPAVQRNAGRLPRRELPVWPFSTHRHRFFSQARVSCVYSMFINTASTLDGTIWGRFMAIGPYGVSPFLMRSLHTVYPAVDLAEKPRIGV